MTPSPSPFPSSLDEMFWFRVSCGVLPYAHPETLKNPPQRIHPHTTRDIRRNARRERSVGIGSSNRMEEMGKHRRGSVGTHGRIRVQPIHKSYCICPTAGQRKDHSSCSTRDEAGAQRMLPNYRHSAYLSSIKTIRQQSSAYVRLTKYHTSAPHCFSWQPIAI